MTTGIEKMFLTRHYREDIDGWYREDVLDWTLQGRWDWEVFPHRLVAFYDTRSESSGRLIFNYPIPAGGGRQEGVRNQTSIPDQGSTCVIPLVLKLARDLLLRFALRNAGLTG